MSVTIRELGKAACAECGHPDPHRPHPDGTGRPSTVLKCASCPDGKCVLKADGDE